MSILLPVLICGCCTRAIKIDGGADELPANNFASIKIKRVFTNFLGHDADISALIGHVYSSDTNSIPVTLKITHYWNNESTLLQRINLIPSTLTLLIWPCWVNEKWTTKVFIQDVNGNLIDTISFDAQERRGISIIPIPTIAQEDTDDYFHFDSFATENGYNITKESFDFSKFMWRQAFNKAYLKLQNKLTRKEIK